jgi:hypothetical protein
MASSIFPKDISCVIAFYDLSDDISFYKGEIERCMDIVIPTEAVMPTKASGPQVGAIAAAVLAASAAAMAAALARAART